MAERYVLVHHDHIEFGGYLREAFPDLPLATFPDERRAAADIEDAGVVLTLGFGMSPAIVARMKRLQWLQCLITGVDHVQPLLQDRPEVLLTNARGIHGPQMTEMIVFHMLALNRQIAALMHNKAAHHWGRVEMRVLDRKTAVIVGVGAIAEHCARVLKGFGMHTVGVSGVPRDVAGFDRMMPRSQLAEAAALADFLIVLAPYTDENDRMIDAGVLAAMKPTAFLVNVSRGGVVDEPALIKALRAGTIAGAGLDVVTRQPLAKSSPLWDMENVFITPQSAWMSDWNVENCAKKVVIPNIRHWRAGERDRMINVVHD